MADAIVGDFSHQNSTENSTFIDSTLLISVIYNYFNDKVCIKTIFIMCYFGKTSTLKKLYKIYGKFYIETFTWEFLGSTYPGLEIDCKVL